MADKEVETKPTFEDVLETFWGSNPEGIWMGHLVNTLETRRMVANAIGTLVRDSYRRWYRTMDELKDQKDVDDNVDPMYHRAPANPLEGINLHEKLNPGDVVEMTTQSDQTQHGPQVDVHGKVVREENRTVSHADLEATEPNPEDTEKAVPTSGVTLGDSDRPSTQSAQRKSDDKDAPARTPEARRSSS